MINIRAPPPRVFDQLRKANAIVAEVFERLKSEVTPEITTGELDRIAEAYIRSRGAVPAFKGYRGFPATPYLPRSMKRLFTGSRAREN